MSRLAGPEPKKRQTGARTNHERVSGQFLQPVANFLDGVWDFLHARASVDTAPVFWERPWRRTGTVSAGSIIRISANFASVTGAPAFDKKVRRHRLERKS